MTFKIDENLLGNFSGEKQPEVISVRKLKGKPKEKQLDILEEIETADSKPLEPVPNLSKDDLPIFLIKELPSGFFPYPKNKNEKVYYKPYSWGGAKKFSQSTLTVIDEWDYILQGIETTFDKELLTLQDFFYIALSRRLATVGETKFSATVKCNNVLDEKKCESLNHVNISSNQIRFYDLALNEKQLPVKIKLKEKWYEFTPITLKDSKWLLKNNLNKDEDAQIAITCRNAPFEEILDVIKSESLPFLEGQYLSELELLFFHGVMPIELNSEGKEIICEKCKKKIKIFLDGGGTIIRPFRELGVNARDRICFGVQNASGLETH